LYCESIGLVVWPHLCCALRHAGISDKWTSEKAEFINRIS
jgi:hypothetical protein